MKSNRRRCPKHPTCWLTELLTSATCSLCEDQERVRQRKAKVLAGKNEPLDVKFAKHIQRWAEIGGE